MEIENPATETTAETIAPQEIPEQDDAEARIAELEAEAIQIREERENYKKAYLKQVEKVRENDVEESEDDRLRRIVREETGNTRLLQIEREKEVELKRLAKENKELKLAQMNKTGEPLASMGSHSEGTPVSDTLVTPDQMAYFKAKNWSADDIEKYKRNLLKNTR